MRHNSIELFAGGGGLALGVSNAGFKHEAVLEWNPEACRTLEKNRGVTNWPHVLQMDVRDFSFRNYEGKIDLLAGGPPCQGFSIGGKGLGMDDDRNMFPETFRAVRELRPKAILIENVKGLLRSSFENYSEFIRLQLSYPTVIQKPGESWKDHFSRLEKHHTKGKVRDLSYKVVLRLLNAADYGIPQKRERVFFVGFRSDLGVDWAFPEPTHSANKLLYDKHISGEYWERNKVPKNSRPRPNTKETGRLKHLESLFPPNGHAWVTVRDALAGLPDPLNGKAKAIPNHQFIGGARIYPGHTGSPLDEPSKTLKAGDHGVPGGENMIAFPDGSVRYFTVREAARIQTFPDDFIFEGSWGEMMRQMGNAVPVRLGQVVASSIALKLNNLE
jgi:DNA (cytosine-5)-methyltransferase 1